MARTKHAFALALALVGLVALEHAYFFVLESFLWTRPLGLKVFRNSPERAEATRVLAANQGVYNGFLSVGLVWGMLHPTPLVGLKVMFFFLLWRRRCGRVAPAQRRRARVG
ncbi:MAG: DUF1304 domain-containing protein [Myxococcaceae bacterium]